MPYIEPELREKFTASLELLPEFANKGELEFIIFSVMKAYMSARKFNFDNLSDTVYAAQHCSDEFRTRFLNKRERSACKKNGDII
jgi:hypothetical protein